MPKSIVSFTFLGTCQHRDTHDSVILESFNTIQKHAEQPDSRVVARLFDGPGCTGSANHPEPGTYVYQNQTKTVASKKVMSQWLHRFHNWTKTLYSAVTGASVEASLLEATLFLEEVIKNNGGVLPKTINLQGFSRGGDNCVRFANIINRLHPSITVNLCLIDPVPGPFRRDDPDSFIIPDNVQDCSVTLMLNEHRRGFKPQHMGRYIFQSTETRVSTHYCAGMHGAGLATEVGNDLTPNSTQMLTLDTLLKFNCDHGSLPENTSIHYQHQRSGENYKRIKLEKPRAKLSPQARLQLLCISMDKYLTLYERDSAQYHVYSRTILRSRTENVLDADLFIDQEHRELFKEIFPATFNWFFEKNYTPKGQPPYTKSQVFEELKTLNNTRYGRFRKIFFKKFHLSAMTSAAGIMPPQGKFHHEQPTFGRALVTDELSYLRYSLSNIINYYHYHHADHDALSDKQRNEIKRMLNDSVQEEDAMATWKLSGLIAKIKSLPGKGFIYKQVSKIIHDPEKYYKNVITLLKAHSIRLPDADTQLLNEVLVCIQDVIGDPSQDNYQKRVQIQIYLTSFYTNLIKLHEDVPVTPQVVKLSNALKGLTEPSYAETTDIDKIIYDLECYVNWRSFVPCYFANYLLDTTKINLAKSVIEELIAVKDMGGNLIQVKQILEKASTGFLRPGSEKELSWMSQLQFKSDYLNTLILKHLEKVVSITSIFSHPMDDEPAHHLGHSR